MELSLTGWVICDCDIDKSIFRALLSAYYIYTYMVLVSACLPAFNRPLIFLFASHSIANQHSIPFVAHGRMDAEWTNCSVTVCALQCCILSRAMYRPRLTRHTDEFSPCMIYEERKRFTYSYAKLITNMQDISAQHQLWPGTCRFQLSYVFFSFSFTLHSAEWMFIQRCLLFARFSPKKKQFNKMHENAINISNQMEKTEKQNREMRSKRENSIKKPENCGAACFQADTNHLSIVKGFSHWNGSISLSAYIISIWILVQLQKRNSFIVYSRPE